MSSKKITYTSDFKLKVLEHYFKHGGDDIFGLKKKTAGYFNIDKKTINRMLNNPDMVKRARKIIAAKKTGNIKSTAVTSRQPMKTTVKNARSGGNASKSTPAGRTGSSSQSSASGSTSNSNKATTSSTSSTKSIGRQVGHTASGSNVNGTERTTPSKSRPGGTEEKNVPGVQVFELPEDPDYSLLKKSISSSSNGVASLANLLVTGTVEVRTVILNECDVILECKVCRNLFRSVVNFLAHKRIYCQDEFADVRTLFHKGDIQGVTSQSNTVVVEPEPPPDSENFDPLRTTVPSAHTSPLKPGSQSRTKYSAIDSIALKLARKRKAFHSSSTNVGSSSYFQSLNEISRNRDKLSRDCSVVLEDISGVSNAVFQSYIPPGSTPNTAMSCMVDEASHSKSGITVAINQNGEIVKTAAGDVTSMEVEEEVLSAEARDLTCLLCNTRFATQKTLSVHQRSHHGLERCVYTCPICKTSFSSMWAVVRHLQITHKKNKNQIERLRKVVRKNVQKKMVYTSPVKNDPSSDADKEGNDSTEEAEEEDEEEDSNDSSSKTSEVVPKRGEDSSALQMTSHKNDIANSRRSPDHRCVKCERKFNNPAALSSHDKFCSLMQMVPPDSSLNPCLRSETPEKKIAIQIRKDYKKPATPFDLNKTPQLMFKIPKTPQEQENQTKIEEMMGEFCNLPTFSCIPCGKRFQNVSTLKRHAASHIEWTRFECSVCHYKSYHRYEVINHCMNEHKAKGSAAANMILEEERIGTLKFFLDNEDETPFSTEVEQELKLPICPTSSEVLNKACETATPADDLEKKHEENEPHESSHLDSVEPMSVTGCDENKCKEDKINDLCMEKTSENEKDLLVSVETKLSKVEETSSFCKPKETYQLAPSQVAETFNSESAVNCIHPSNSKDDTMEIEKSIHDETHKYSHEEQMKDSFEEDRLKKLHQIENKKITCKEETQTSVLQHLKSALFENEEACSHKDGDKNVIVGSIIKSPKEETSNSPENEESKDTVDKAEKKDKSTVNELENNVSAEVKSVCLKNKSSNCKESHKSQSKETDKDIISQDNVNESSGKEIKNMKDELLMERETMSVCIKTEKSSCNENDKKQSKEADKDEISKDNINETSGEEKQKLKEPLIMESNSKVNESGKSKEEVCKMESTFESTKTDSCCYENRTSSNSGDKKSNQSTDVLDPHPAINIKEITDDHDIRTDASQGNLQIKGNDDDSVVLLGQTDIVELGALPTEAVDIDSLTECSEQTVMSQSASAAEISSLEGNAESPGIDDDSTSIKQEEDRWMTDDDDDEEDQDPRSAFASDLSDYTDPNLVDIFRYVDMKHGQNFGTMQLDKEVKTSIPKDDLSLELKDFVGFPSEKDERAKKPNRVRCSAEQKDFVYDLKKAQTHTDEMEAEGSNILGKEGEGIKQERGKACTRRRSLVTESEIMPKRIKSEEEENSHKSYNGSDVQSSSQDIVAISQSADASGYECSSSSFERKRVRPSRRRMDINLCEEFAFPKDGSKPNASESETSCANPKLVKESLTVTRYSPRLKMSASPVPKKGSKPDFLSSSNQPLLTNGQGQAVSMLNTAKVKLKGEP